LSASCPVTVKLTVLNTDIFLHCTRKLQHHNTLLPQTILSCCASCKRFFARSCAVSSTRVCRAFVLASHERREPLTPRNPANPLARLQADAGIRNILTLDVHRVLHPTTQQASGAFSYIIRSKTSNNLSSNLSTYLPTLFIYFSDRRRPTEGVNAHAQWVVFSIRYLWCFPLAAVVLH